MVIDLSDFDEVLKENLLKPFQKIRTAVTSHGNTAICFLKKTVNRF